MRMSDTPHDVQPDIGPSWPAEEGTVSWDLQDIGAHLREKHGYVGEWASYLPVTFEEREKEHDQDHDDRAVSHEHDPNDTRIIKEV